LCLKVKGKGTGNTAVLEGLVISVISHLLLPALDFGTVYLLTSSLPRHLQHFVIYFGNLTQTLCYNYIAIVVLEVSLT